MYRTSIIGTVLFTLAAIVLFILLAFVDSNLVLVLSNIASGCTIKAVGLWITFFADKKDNHGGICLTVSAIALVILLLVAFSVMWWMGFFLLLFAGFGSVIVFVLDLILFLLSRLITRFRRINVSET